MLIHNKDDIEFVTEFPCLLGHPIQSLNIICIGDIYALCVFCYTHRFFFENVIFNHLLCNVIDQFFKKKKLVETATGVSFIDLKTIFELLLLTKSQLLTLKFPCFNLYGEEVLAPSGRT